MSGIPHTTALHQIFLQIKVLIKSDFLTFILNIAKFSLFLAFLFIKFGNFTYKVGSVSFNHPKTNLNLLQRTHLKTILIDG